ncbi:hypothetical protein [Parvularcula oceani]|uniref:hypothetical protein n=1 Tax=Parvularcula oceani TaxID=1247963 RepID=UPI0009DD0CF9|nr:hypothetical protein [Parvularcula oceani]
MGMAKNREATGKKAASAASKTLRGTTASKSAKSAAGSALTQTRAKVLDPSSPEAAVKFRKDSKTYMAKHAATKASALAALQDLGVVTKTGRLTKPYRTVKKTA